MTSLILLIFLFISAGSLQCIQMRLPSRFKRTPTDSILLFFEIMRHSFLTEVGHTSEDVDGTASEISNHKMNVNDFLWNCIAQSNTFISGTVIFLSVVQAIL